MPEKLPAHKEAPKVRNHISFREDIHQYKNLETNEVYTSGTSFIGKFHPHFNALEVATNLVENNKKYKDTTVEALLAEWSESAKMGTRVHKFLEDHLKGELDITKLPEGHIKRVGQLTSAWDNLRLQEEFKGWDIVPEMILYLDSHKLAGQSDLVVINHSNKSFRILDYKTNKKGIATTAYRNETMFAPVNHLPECKFTHYALQLSLYAYMLEQEMGYTCEGNEILWVDTNSPDKVEIQRWETPYFRDEIVEMLEAFSSPEENSLDKK